MSMEEHPSKPPEDQEKSLEDYSCGWYKDRILIPGRLFIAKTHVSFQSSFGQQPPVVVNIADITGLHKKNTAYVFPNAIEIATKAQKYFFGSFYFRDQAFTTLQNLLPHAEGIHDGDEDESFSQLLDTSDTYVDEDEKQGRVRASSTNSDDEELKPLAATKAAGQKALAAMKRTMTKSASERIIPTERSSTPPPQSYSPQPTAHYNISPSVSPALRHEIPAMELSGTDQDADASVEVVEAHEAVDALQGSGEVDAQGQSHDTSFVQEHSDTSITPSPAESLSSSPLRTPIAEEFEQNGTDTHAHAHEHEHEVVQEAAEHPVTPIPESLTPIAETPVSNIGSSTSAPPSPLPNGTTFKKQPELIEKIKLPPIVENCEHMTYPPYSDTFAPFVDETFPCPIQDLYRLVLATNFWTEINDSCGYTDATATPWLTRTNSAGPCCIYRQINFKMELTGKIGPKSTRVQQTQRCRLKNSKELILETSSVSPDVPYADSFTTDNLLIMKAANGGASCHLRIACRVNFLKSTWGFGGIIEKNAIQGSKDFFAVWLVAVRAKIEKEYTKPRSLTTPPPVKNPPPSSPLSHSQNIKSPATARPQLATHPTHHSSPSLTHVPVGSAKPASLTPAANQTSAFTPVSPSSKKFWPTLQQQVSQMSIPVAALCLLVLLILSIGLPYTLYLHSRVAHAESRIGEFNSAVARIENKISFMQLYINYLKENPNAPLPASSNTPKDDLRTELAGLAHLMHVTSSLEKRMDDWKSQLDGAGRALSGTQDLVATLRSEMGGVLLRKEGDAGAESGGGGGWVYFSVGLVVSLGVVGASMYYFRDSLPFKLK